ncbi:RNA polymerase sigma factor [Fulvivirgaceae bacterium BMA12]|uniref:RNA polymerase sigma factor n=1 Tax=Agaribacillus aureus TaxID=3051825 RepID=A0ABT8KYF8_9BACT|nr:RNA polymerase sigma factor [Fulvivirgaceae bacterium BMA12]
MEDLEDLLNRGYRYGFSLTNDEDQAFELLQNAYLKIRENNKPLIVPYLIRTIRNDYIDAKRKEKTKFKWFKNNRSTSGAYIPANGVEPVLDRLLTELKDREREILLLSVVEEYTAKEIGELLGMPRNTVLSILSRTKKKLKLALNENYVK